MNDNVAYCGIICTECPLYIATQKNDFEMKKKIQSEYEELYHRPFDLEDIKCYGCKSDKKFFLSNKCNITPCNKNKGIDTCSQCNNHPCKRIEKFYNWHEEHHTNETFYKPEVDT